MSEDLPNLAVTSKPKPRGQAMSDDQTGEDPEQPKRAEKHDRKRNGDRHFDQGDYRSPINVDGLRHARRMPAARLIHVDGSIIFRAPVIFPALRWWPVPLVHHSAIMPWS
jgi:hypothetical protein